MAIRKQLKKNEQPPKQLHTKEIDELRSDKFLHNGPFPYAVGAQFMPEVGYRNYFQGKWLLSGWRFCLEE